jgi:serine/threonine-protein kinase
VIPERWQKIENIYHSALELPAGRRAEFLRTSCAGDEDLIREVESLLESHGQASGFMENSPGDLAAEILAEIKTKSMVGLRLGHYRLHSLLGSGGMGEVYRAHDPRLDRDVAVKILPEHLAEDAEALHRFEREARAVAALSHPNILSIFDFGTEENTVYAVMELLEGETLRDCLKRGPLEWRRAAEIGIAIADGVEAAHAKGIIHRDLKPENIFLTSNGGVKILDFGIARVTQTVSPDSITRSSGSDVTRPGMVMGTLGYMSPEQVKGKAAETTSDIFSLGCVLYEMVSGQHTFKGETGAELVAAILKEDPPPLSTLGIKIPPELERIIRHCLEKQAEQRFQSARELASDLRGMLSNGGQVMKPPMQIKLPARAVIRIGAVLAVLLLGLGMWFYWFGKAQAIDSIAVLPLVNVTKDADVEYLSDGITDSLINSLSQLSQLKRVIARSSVDNYKGKTVDPRIVGKELNVRAIVTGKMFQRGDDLNITAELVNVADGSRLWGEHYNRKLSELQAMQEDITRNISESLSLKLSGGEQERLAKRQTTNNEAHLLYLKGRYFWNKSDQAGLKKALEFFKQAIDLDPNYALAYSGMADVYYFFSDNYIPAVEAMPKARAAAQEALKRDDKLAEAQATLAGVKWQYDWDWAEAERAFKRALELNPGYASAHNQYGGFLCTMGRFAEAQIEMDRAYELDPLSPYLHVGTVWPLYFARQYDQAIERFRLIVAMNPDFPNAYLNLGWAYAQRGMFQEAIDALSKARSLDDSWFNLAWLGATYAKAGRRDEAKKALAELKDKAVKGQPAEYGLALVYAGLGDKDKALAELEKACQMRNGFAIYLKMDPYLDSLRSDPRFIDLLRRLKFEP